MTDFDRRFESFENALIRMDEKLDKIYDQTKQTNGRVNVLEEQHKNMTKDIFETRNNADKGLNRVWATLKIVGVPSLLLLLIVVAVLLSKNIILPENLK